MSEMRPGRLRRARLGAIAVSVVIGAQGLIHLLGVVLLWKLGQPGQLRYAYAVPTPGSVGAYVVGGLWLVAAALFVTAAVLLSAGLGAWRLTVLAGVVISVSVLGLAPRHTIGGLIGDGLVLALVTVSWLRTRRRSGAPRPQNKNEEADEADEHEPRA